MGDSAARILVVDDELALRRVLSTTLTSLGFVVFTEPTGERAIESLRKEPFDAVLLDLNMPGMGGMATCRLVRQEHPRTGILVVTVREEQQVRIEALDAGADDYIIKPFDVRELVARLRAVVRRSRRVDSSELGTIRIGTLELDWQNRSLTISGQPVHLTPNEFALLYCLMSHAGELVPHSDVFRAVWGPDETGDPRRLRSLVRQLRRKIEEHPGEPHYLVAEPGFGYRFRVRDLEPLPFPARRTID